MTKDQIMTYVAAILTTLQECGGSGPESSVYLALGMDINVYSDIRGLLVASGLVTCKSYTLRLTEKGDQLATECNALLAAK